MLKKLIIIIPLVVVLLIPTLIISSSAAESSKTLSISNGCVVSNWNARIGYAISDGTWWAPSNTIFARVNLENNNNFQIRLVPPPNDNLGAYSRVFTFDLTLPETDLLYDLTLNIDTSNYVDYGWPSLLGSEVSCGNNEGTVSLSSSLPLVTYSIKNLHGGSVVNFSFGFDQHVSNYELILNCLLVDLDVVGSADSDPSSYVVLQSSYFDVVFPLKSYFGGFNRQDPIFDYNHTDFTLSPSVVGDSVVFRSYPYYPSEQNVRYCNIYTGPYWFSKDDFEFIDDRYYRIIFSLRCSNPSQIGYSMNFNSLKISYGAGDGYFYVDKNALTIYPTSKYSKQEGSSKIGYLDFDFILSGKVLNDYNIWYFRFGTIDLKYAYVNFSFDKAFTVICLSEEESKEQNTINSILDYGSNIPKPDLNNSAGELDSAADKITSIENDYKIDSAQVNQLSNSTSKFFNGVDFRNAASVTTGWIDKFASENSVFWSFILTSLTLGLVFFVLGRGS